MFEGGTVMRMFLVEIDARLSGATLTDDQITDMIATIVDELDHLGVEPSVGTTRVGGQVVVTVGVTVERDEEFEALTFAVAAIKAAFHSAGLATAGLAVPRDLRSRVMPQPA